MRPLLFILSFLLVPFTYALSPQETSLISTILASNRALWAAARELPADTPLRRTADVFEHVCQQLQDVSDDARRLSSELRQLARAHSQDKEAEQVFRAVRRSLSKRLKELGAKDEPAALELASAYKRLQKDVFAFLTAVASEDEDLVRFLEKRLRIAFTLESKED